MAFGKWPRSGFLFGAPWWALAALVVLLAGCGGGGGDDGGGGGGGGTGTATVTGRVVDAISGLGVAGATITYGGATATSSATGTFSLTVNAPAAIQRLTATAPNYRNLGQYNGATVRLATEGISVQALTVDQTVNIGTIQLYSTDSPPPPPSL